MIYYRGAEKRMPFSCITLLILQVVKPVAKWSRTKQKAKIESFLPCFLIQFRVIHIEMDVIEDE